MGAKRRSTFGRVYFRKDRGRWFIRYPDPMRPASPGRRAPYVVRSVSQNRKDAERLLEAVRRAVLAGTYRAPAPEPREQTLPPGMTLPEAIDAYIAAKEAEGKSSSTVRSYAATRERLAASPIGKRLVAEVTPSDIETYMAWRRENLWKSIRRRSKGTVKDLVPAEVAQPSNSTVNRDIGCIAAALNRLVRLRVLTENPCDRVRRPKESKRSRVALSKDEARRLVGECSPWLRPIVVAALLTGARFGELTRLRWGDVNFDSNTINLVRPKVGNASAIPMHPALADELQALREGRAVAGGRTVAATEYVFLSETGRRVRYVHEDWAAALEKAGLAGRPGLTFHSLRHTFAVHFLEGGAAITDLQALLGHASVATTQIYARMVDARTRDSVMKMDFGIRPAAVRSIEEKMRTRCGPENPGDDGPEGVREAI